jgi:hypothetical protein
MILCAGSVLCAAEPDLRSNEAAEFLTEFVGRLQPLQTEVNLAWWDASTKGDDESFQQKQSDILRLFDELDWNELTEFATGEQLNPKAFAEDFRP